MFRLAKKHLAITKESNGFSTKRGFNEYLLAEIVRKIFGVGQGRGVSRYRGGAHGASSDTDTPEDTCVSGIRLKNVAEETWAGKILAGGDSLRTTGMDKILYESGFELILAFGRCGQVEKVGNLHGILEHVSDMILENLSRWEMADLADSFWPSLVLVHQVLVVWHGNASIGSVVS